MYEPVDQGLVLWGAGSGKREIEDSKRGAQVDQRVDTSSKEIHGDKVEE